MAEIIGVRFKREGKQYYFDPNGLQIEPGQGVILETAWGLEYGVCARGNSEIPERELVAPLRPIIRLATEEDERTLARAQQRAREALELCTRKVEEHKLDMRLVDVECSFEGTRILFFFTSEGRVDFRALVKDLASAFHTRIELRQIGVRDEAKMLGGLGICGRPFCCASFLQEFQPVSIKMAKTQSLSLNPTKISGTCGRLMCCLKYEQHAYEDLLKTSPHVNSFVETPDGVGDIISVQTLREKVRVRLDSEPDSLKTYHNSEIRVVRAGKGRRPEDYVAPPLSELNRLRREPESKEQEDALRNELPARGMLIREPEAPAAPPAPSESERRGRRSRGGNKGREQRQAAEAPQTVLPTGEKGRMEEKPQTDDKFSVAEKPPVEGKPPAGNKEQNPPAGDKRPSKRRGRRTSEKSGEKQSAKQEQTPPTAKPAEGGGEAPAKKSRGYWRRRPKKGNE